MIRKWCVQIIAQFFVLGTAFIYAPVAFSYASVELESTASEALLYADYPFEYEQHFTDTICWVSGECSGRVMDRRRNMSRALEQAVDQATLSIDIAAYGISKQKWLMRHLGKMTNRHVAVRAVVDQVRGEFPEWLPGNFTYPDTSELVRFIGEGMVMPDLNHNTGRPRSSTIMHNKFVVFDKRAVWLGTANFSHTCMGDEYNANNAILVRSPTLAKIYSREFEQMFAKQRFSRAKLAPARANKVLFSDGTRAEVYFSPQDDAINAAILPFIAKAESSLDIAMFFLTEPRIADAVVDAISRGVRVRLIYDGLAARHSSSRHDLIRASGGEVRVENWGGKMHMKTAVADGMHLLTGSMNWSAAGNLRNDENTLVIYHNPQVAAEFTQHFESLWQTLPDDQTYKTEPRAESLNSVNSCFDGIDNDHNGYVDDADFGCRSAS